MSASTELPPVGFKTDTQRTYSQGDYTFLELDGAKISKGKLGDTRKPVDREFLLKNSQPNEGPKKIIYKPLVDSDTLVQLGSTPESSRYIVHNGVYVEAGINLPEGNLSVRFNKMDGSLMGAPEFNPVIFPSAEFLLQIPDKELKMMGPLFSSLRSLNFPNPQEFYNVLQLIDSAIQTSPPSTQLQML